MKFDKKLYNLIEENSTELKSNISLFQDIDDSQLLRDCNYIEYKLKTINQAKLSPSAFAVFGESQVGKSFLISELVGGKDSTLNIKGFEDKRFIDLNDSNSGGETTALVTRLTHVVDSTVPDAHVKIKLMHVEDLIWSTANGFYSELMGFNLELPDSIDEDIKSEISNLKTIIESSQNNPLGEIMTKNIINAYVNCINNLSDSYKNNAVIAHVVKVKDFITSSENQDRISNLSIDSLGSIIKSIWMGNPILTNYFNLQLRLLNHFNYEDELYLNCSNVSSIINVGDESIELSSINTSQYPVINNKVIEFSTNGNEEKVANYLLQLVIKEVVIPIKSSSKLLSLIDILDFPGARSMGQKVDLKNISDNNWSEMFKRGKIKYFFNHYVEIHEITFLLLAMSLDNQPEVKNLPLMIKDWKDNLGTEVDNKLFIALTKSDTLLNNKSSKKEFSDAINKKMKAFSILYESINLDDWNNSGNPFSDYYFVRNPMADNKGYDPEGNLRSDYESVLVDLKDAFLHSSALNKIFKNNNLDDIFTNTFVSPNNGIPYMVDKILSKIGSNPSGAKYNYLNSSMHDIKKELLALLKANGVIPRSDQEQQNIDEIETLINTLKGNDYMNLVNFLDVFVNSFPDSQSLHNIVVANKSSSSIWGSDDDGIYKSIDEFIKNWFHYKIDRTELSKKSQVEPHIIKNYLKHMRSDILTIIKENYAEDLNTYLSEPSENNSYILTMILHWVCGNHFTYLGNDLEYKTPDVSDIPKLEIMPKRILNIWQTKLLSIYSGVDDSITTTNNNEKLLSIYNKLS